MPSQGQAGVRAACAKGLSKQAAIIEIYTTEEVEGECWGGGGLPDAAENVAVCVYARVRVLKHIYSLLWYEFSLHESEFLIQGF